MAMQRLGLFAEMVLVQTEKNEMEQLAVSYDPDTDEIEVLLLAPSEAARLKLIAIPQDSPRRKIAKGKWRTKPTGQ